MRVAEKLIDYEPAEDLHSEEAIAVFMAEALRTNDRLYISHALDVVARTREIAGLRVDGIAD